MAAERIISGAGQRSPLETPAGYWSGYRLRTLSRMGKAALKKSRQNPNQYSQSRKSLFPPTRTERPPNTPSIRSTSYHTSEKTQVIQWYFHFYFLSSPVPLKLLWVKPCAEETLYQKNRWFKHRLSLELQEVVCSDDGILFLRWRLAGVVLKGEWFSSITRDGGREEQPTRKFFISFVEYWCTNPKQTCQLIFKKKKKTKTQKNKNQRIIPKVWLSLPHPTGRNQG